MQARAAEIELKELPRRHRLVVLRIYVAIAKCLLYRDLEAGVNQFLKS